MTLWRDIELPEANPHNVASDLLSGNPNQIREIMSECTFDSIMTLDESLSSLGLQELSTRELATINGDGNLAKIAGWIAGQTVNFLEYANEGFGGTFKTMSYSW